MKRIDYAVLGLSAVVMLAFSGCFEKQNELHESMVSCPEKTQLISDDFEGKPVCQLRGTYSEDLHLTSYKFCSIKCELNICLYGKSSSDL